MNASTSSEQRTTHTIYYQNQYSPAYKTDERVLKQIIKNNTKCSSDNEHLQLIIYYKSHTIASLVSKNNQSPKPSALKQTNVVYEYSCNHGDCELQKHSYIGMTTTTLSRRLTMHLASGGPKTHAKNAHNAILTRDELVSNTKILRHEPDYNRLQILEALLILQSNPSINNQITGSHRTLKLHGGRWLYLSGGPVHRRGYSHAEAFL